MSDIFVHVPFISPGDHLFIEPMDWMQNINEPSGKLRCNGCSLVLGSFDWRGDACPWGERIVPAFRIDSGLVLVRERPPSRTNQSRRPTDKDPANSGTPLALEQKDIENRF